MIRDTLLGLPRNLKRGLQVLADIALIWLALWLAFYIRLGNAQPIDPLGGHAWLFLAAPALSIPLFIRLGLYRAVLRYVGGDALLAITKAVTLSSLLLALAIYWYREAPALVPRSMIFNYWWLSLMLIGGLRLLMRHFFLGDWYRVGINIPFLSPNNTLPRVAIYGAGSAGNQLVVALRMGMMLRPMAFIDDDPNLSNRLISGLRVYKPRHIQQMLCETGVTEILLALPSVTHQRRRAILNALEGYPVRVRSVPNLSDLVNGRVGVQQLQEVDILDLLGRDVVEPNMDLFQRCIHQQTVMVTGAGGSIGAELCRQILTQQPRVLILFEHSEFNLYNIHQELTRTQPTNAPLQLVPILGSVRDPQRLEEVLRCWKVDTLYHAAAYKHVPIVEHNVAEGIMNNLFGTLYTAQAAIRAQVRHFVLISTDKAVRPTNVMGATKRLAEMLLQALSHESQPILFEEEQPTRQNTTFVMVRFGNVLGSSGSVIPLFREQIHKGGPVTVTHPEMTRYFMTIPEAAQLVIQAGALAQGGEVFVLNMGEPVLITELARKMIRLAGFRVRDAEHPNGDIAIEFTGLRAGEKLYEELLIGDQVAPTQHPMIFCAHEEYLEWSKLRAWLEQLKHALHNEQGAYIRALLQQVVRGYQPEGAIVDWVHTHQTPAPSIAKTLHKIDS